MNSIVFFTIIGLIIIVSILKVLNIIYNKYGEKKKAPNNGKPNNLTLMSAKPKYNSYKKISERTLSHNSPQRENGDFYDCILNQYVQDSSAIENKILDMYGVDLGE